MVTYSVRLSTKKARTSRCNNHKILYQKALLRNAMTVYIECANGNLSYEIAFTYYHSYFVLVFTPRICESFITVLDVYVVA
jgi:hypothetical protein